MGKEAEVVRSAALLAVGSFYLLYSFLPPTMGKVATWLSGFKGDRQRGLSYMYTCWKEDGICAPWGALNYISYHVDTRTFIGERMTEEENLIVAKMLDQYRIKYPNSILFSLLESNLFACYRDVKTARRLNDEMAPHLRELPALESVMLLRRGSYLWTDGDWFNAGVAYEEAMNIYRKGNRRSMIPFLATYAFLSSLQAIKEQPEHAPSAIDRCRRLNQVLTDLEKKMKKTWGRQDAHAFEIFRSYKRCRFTLLAYS